MSFAAPDPADASFPTTRWSIVLAARDVTGDAAEVLARRALEELCRTYWPPVYTYLRRRTANVEDARDLTQDFFARLLDGRLLRAATPARGRFRSLLLTAAKNFLANEHERANAAKRGGGRTSLRFEFDDVEARWAAGAAQVNSLDRQFEREWAVALLTTVLDRLADEFGRQAKQQQFAALKPYLTEDDAATGHAELARRLGVSVGAARAALYRFRKRYQELLLDEIAQTVDSPDQAADELRDLFRAFD